MSLPLIFRRFYAVRPLPRPKDPLTTSSRARIYEIAPGVTFIHRPPETAPSPHSLTSAPASPILALPAAPPTPPEIPLPPLTRKPREPHILLTVEQVEEARALRAADPVTNTAGELARRYGCTAAYISAVAPLPKAERKEAIERRTASERRDRWGPKKRLIRDVRQKRRDFW